MLEEMRSKVEDAEIYVVSVITQFRSFMKEKLGAFRETRFFVKKFVFLFWTLSLYIFSKRKETV